MSKDLLQTRREFLRRGVTLAAAAGTVPSFLTQSAWALDDPAASEARIDRDARVLVVLQLAGGNDGLNTLVPYADDAYRRERPNLALATGEILAIDDCVGLHPRLADLKALYDEGLLGVVQGVGYPNPNRSHFRSMEIWETAVDSDEHERYGWIGRYFDNACQGAPDDALIGLQVGRRMTRAFANASSVGVSLQRPEQYRWLPSDPHDGERQHAVYEALNQSAAGDPGSSLDFLRRTALNAELSSVRIADLAAHHRDTVDYPDTPLAQDLKLVAQMIAGGLPSRIYYVSQGGYDTHAQQAGQHDDLLGDMAAALRAFHRDLADQGNLERVAVMAFSEFGRRVKENGSGGTDHGAAGLLFLTGGAIVPGLHGAYPSLTDLANGDLRHTVDFRQVYATLLEDWLSTPSEPVLGRRFEKVGVVKA